MLVEAIVESMAMYAPNQDRCSFIVGLKEDSKLVDTYRDAAFEEANKNIIIISLEQLIEIQSHEIPLSCHTLEQAAGHMADESKHYIVTKWHKGITCLAMHNRWCLVVATDEQAIVAKLRGDTVFNAAELADKTEYSFELTMEARYRRVVVEDRMGK